MSEFETNTRNLLRSSERTIDGETAKRLSKARSEALSSVRKPGLPAFFIPASGMALASILALVLIYSPITDQPSIDEELLLSEGVELYEDLDFYQWLASEEAYRQG